MIASEYSPRIAIFGPEESTSAECRGCSLWEVGYVASVCPEMAGFSRRSPARHSVTHH
jgi:hypothetical protein